MDASQRETPPDEGSRLTLQSTLGLAVIVGGTVTLFAGLILLCALFSTRPAEPQELQACTEKQERDLLSVTPGSRGGSCPDGWRWWRHHCYFFSSGLQENRQWNGSAEFCLEHNSSLAVIKDSAEMDFIQGVMKTLSRFPFLWVGLSDAEQEGLWLWWDGVDVQHYMSVTVEWDADHRDCADLRGGGSLFAADCQAYGPWVCKRET